MYKKCRRKFPTKDLHSLGRSIRRWLKYTPIIMHTVCDLLYLLISWCLWFKPYMSGLLQLLRDYGFPSANRPISQIRQCIRWIPMRHCFVTDICTHVHSSFIKMLHCGMWDRCIVGFVKRVKQPWMMWINILHESTTNSKHVRKKNQQDFMHMASMSHGRLNHSNNWQLDYLYNSAIT